MASIQACGSAEAYHAKHTTVVNEMCNLAQNEVNKRRRDHVVTTVGCIRNNAKGNCIKFLTKHDWEGKNKIAYPESIPKYQNGIFVHSAHGSLPFDDAAVVYSDESGAGWLLAWSVRDHTGCVDQVNKVYVETGPIERYMCIDWDTIKAKLDISGDTSYDETGGNEVFAKISTGNKPTLVASFNNYDDSC